MAKKTVAKKSRATRATSRVSPSKAKAPSKQKSSGHLVQKAFRDGHFHEEDEICSCDLVLADSEITPDESLPSARGGVEQSGGKIL